MATKDQIITRARVEMDKHGLNRWRIETMNTSFLAGECDSANRKLRFSTKLCALWTDEQVNDLIVHEIGHALVDLRYGVGKMKAHGAEFKAMVRSIGGTESAARTTYDDNHKRPETKWLVRSCGCTEDGKEWSVRRRVRDEWCPWCEEYTSYRPLGEPREAAKLFTPKGSRAWVQAKAIALGCDVTGGDVKAPKGKLFYASETHYLTGDDEYMAEDLDDGLTDCTDTECWTCTKE